MLDKAVFPLTLAAALGCGLVAGVFLAFSSFVMRGLVKLPVPQAVSAMQAINVAVVPSVFLAVFMLTALLCVFLGVAALLRWNAPGAPLRLAGSVLYFLGSFIVTVALNVPLNDRIANAKPDALETVALWATYLSQWTAWNHVRTVASFLASLLLTLALYQLRRAG